MEKVLDFYAVQGEQKFNRRRRWIHRPLRLNKNLITFPINPRQLIKLGEYLTVKVVNVRAIRCKTINITWSLKLKLGSVYISFVGFSWKKVHDSSL